MSYDLLYISDLVDQLDDGQVNLIGDYKSQATVAGIQGPNSYFPSLTAKCYRSALIKVRLSILCSDSPP